MQPIFDIVWMLLCLIAKHLIPDLWGIGSGSLGLTQVSFKRSLTNSYNVLMLQSGLNIKSLKENVRIAEVTDEAEVAACIAAVLAFIDSEGQEPESKPEESTGGGNWQKVARLEAAGIKKKRSVAGNIWRFSGLAVLIAFGLSIAAPSFADDSAAEPEQIASSQSANPRFVPAQSPSKHTYIKIGLLVRSNRVDIEALDGAEIRDARNGEVVASLPAQTQWSLNIDGSKSLSFNGKNNVDGARIPDGQPISTITKVAFFPSAPRPLLNKFQLPEQLKSDATDGVSGYIVVPENDRKGNQVVVVNGKLYRGAVWLKPCTQDGGTETSGITAINIVDLEDYLLSVLPSEMPASWPLEALKAQAVAARSYAVANIGKHAKDGYDLRATVDDQVYLGCSNENPKSNRAVAETEGIILKHQGKPVSAFFHSTSGGSTEVAENVWGKSVPYLRMVPDYDDLSPHFAWNRKFKVDDFERAFGPEIGQLTSFMVISRTPSNRVKDALAVGTAGSRYVSGDSLRKLFKLPSTNFNVVYKENTYEFAGRGSGHGLGLSQWGARALAEHGYNAAQILTYYYKDVTVDYLADSTGI